MIILDGHVLVIPENKVPIRKDFSKVNKRSFFDKLLWRGGEYWFVDSNIQLYRVIEWIDINLPKAAVSITSDYRTTFLKIRFKNKEDVMAFKLMWVN